MKLAHGQHGLPVGLLIERYPHVETLWIVGFESMHVAFPATQANTEELQ